MKRSRAETQPSRVSQTLSKAQKRQARFKTTATTAFVAGENAGCDTNRALPVPPVAVAVPSAAGAAAVAEEMELAWSSLWECEGWWWGGIEEEKLLGWFPFVDEDFSFLSSENRGASPPGFWFDDYNDIWHLQHIHEIPSSVNR